MPAATRAKPNRSQGKPETDFDLVSDSCRAWEGLGSMTPPGPTVPGCFSDFRGCSFRITSEKQTLRLAQGR